MLAVNRTHDLTHFYLASHLFDHVSILVSNKSYLVAVIFFHSSLTCHRVSSPLYFLWKSVVDSNNSKFITEKEHFPISLILDPLSQEHIFMTDLAWEIVMTWPLVIPLTTLST